MSQEESELIVTEKQLIAWKIKFDSESHSQVLNISQPSDVSQPSCAVPTPPLNISGSISEDQINVSESIPADQINVSESESIPAADQQHTFETPLISPPVDETENVIEFSICEEGETYSHSYPNMVVEEFNEEGIIGEIINLLLNPINMGRIANN